MSITVPSPVTILSPEEECDKMVVSVVDACILYYSKDGCIVRRWSFNHIQNVSLVSALEKKVQIKFVCGHMGEVTFKTLYEMQHFVQMMMQAIRLNPKLTVAPKSILRNPEPASYILDIQRKAALPPAPKVTLVTFTVPPKPKVNIQVADNSKIENLETAKVESRKVLASELEDCKPFILYIQRKAPQPTAPQVSLTTFPVPPKASMQSHVADKSNKSKSELYRMVVQQMEKDKKTFLEASKPKSEKPNIVGAIFKE